jgi:hypothetical protein
MDSLIVLADIAAMQQPFPTLKERRLVFLERGRAKLAQNRAQRNIKIHPKPKQKKVKNQDWRLENLKKARMAYARKCAYNKMMNEDTEEE